MQGRKNNNHLDFDNIQLIKKGQKGLLVMYFINCIRELYINHEDNKYTILLIKKNKYIYNFFLLLVFRGVPRLVEFSTTACI